MQNVLQGNEDLRRNEDLRELKTVVNALKEKLDNNLPVPNPKTQPLPKGEFINIFK
jgi:hypothetical protein